MNHSTPGCGSEGGSPGTAPAANLPGQSALRWRTAPHGPALARMRARLTQAGRTPAVRALAGQGADDPGIALLDSWAVVGDLVSFYTERIAQEGFLRTATETGSVRQLARTLGYELRPGVAARSELVFQVETAPGAPEAVTVPQGTPIQTVPEPGKLPQTFETSVELEACGVWNEIRVLAWEPQDYSSGDPALWLDMTAPVVHPNDRLLILQPHGDTETSWDLVTVSAVRSDVPNAPGWVRLDLAEKTSGTLSGGVHGLQVLRLTRRFNVFGWNAPDPGLIRDKDGNQIIKEEVDGPGLDATEDSDRDHGTYIDLEGDHPALAQGSWLVLQSAGTILVARSAKVTITGASRFGVTGRITRVTPEPALKTPPDPESGFRRRTTVVLGVAEQLPAARRPLTKPHGGDNTLTVDTTTPPLPVGRLVVVTGLTAQGDTVADVRTLIGVTPVGTDALRITLSAPLLHELRAETVRVHGNVAPATHGETSEQILGSGDGGAGFQRFALRRAPLTYVADPRGATGAVAALEVRVEEVAWSEVPTLLDAGPTARVFTVRQSEDGASHVTFGDGVHGARLPTGTENIRVRYRIGLGVEGRADPDQIRLPVRNPRGIAGVTNLAPSHDSGDPEDLESARTDAPLRIRTLDRAVSVADHGDFARGYAAVGRARADSVWTGRSAVVIVSVLGSDGAGGSDELLSSLRTALDHAREDRAPLTVLAGTVHDVDARLSLDIDPRFRADMVRASVEAELRKSFGGMDLAAALTASAVLVVAAGVEGVVSATMPLLSAPDLPTATPSLVLARSARFAPPDSDASAPPRLLPAQALRLREVVLSP